MYVLEKGDYVSNDLCRVKIPLVETSHDASNYTVTTPYIDLNEANVGLMYNVRDMDNFDYVLLAK